MYTNYTATIKTKWRGKIKYWTKWRGKIIEQIKEERLNIEQIKEEKLNIEHIKEEELNIQTDKGRCRVGGGMDITIETIEDWELRSQLINLFVYLTMVTN